MPGAERSWIRAIDELPEGGADVESYCARGLCGQVKTPAVYAEEIHAMVQFIVDERIKE